MSTIGFGIGRSAASNALREQEWNLYAKIPALYLISDAERVGEKRFVDIVSRAVEGGLSMLQLREPRWPVERVVRFAELLAERFPEEFLLTVNYRPKSEDFDDLYRLLSTGVRGVHLGRCAATAVTDIREQLEESHLVGFSAHTLEEVDDAFRLGADYVSYSPVYSPISKSESVSSHGIDGLRVVCSQTTGPVYALGGINAERAGLTRNAGAAGVAVIGAIVDSANPASATRLLLARVNNKPPTRPPR